VLFGAILIEAVLERARLSSQSQLQEVAFQLSDEQLFSILFEDEIAFAKAGRAEGNNEEPILRLIIGGETPWTFLDMAGLLLAIQVSYNNMHYLVTTEDLDIEHIIAQLTDFRRLVGVEDNIIEFRISNGYTQESGLSWKYETKWDFSTIGKKKTPGDCDAGIRQKLSNRSQSLECFTELGSKMGPVLPPRRSSRIKSQAYSWPPRSTLSARASQA
jgi:hypothetical protein